MTREMFYAVLAGLFIGLVLGLLKTWLLWYRGNPFTPKIKKKRMEPTAVQGVMARSLLSYLINILILGLLYFTRTMLPWPLLPLILSTATGLIACGLIYPLQNMFRK